MSVYLATRGKQDYFLTERPEFTFFQKTYERDVQHENTISNVPFDSGGGTIATIPANGDYVAEITLKVTLPALNPQTNYWTFLGTPPSGKVTFYQNSSDTAVSNINSSNYLSYVSPAGNFLFNFTKGNSQQPLTDNSFVIAVNSTGTNYYTIGLDLNISKNNASPVATGLSTSYAYMTLSKDGSYLYISDYYNGNIIRVTTSEMTVNTSFYTGLDSPSSLSIDNNGNLYVLCGYDTKTVEVIDTIPLVPTKTTINLPNPFAYLLSVDFAGNYIYLLYGNNGLTRIDTLTQEIIEYFNSNIENDYVNDMQIDSSGILYLAYYYRGSISTVSTQTGEVTPNYVIGLSYPASISIMANGTLYILEWNFLNYFTIVGSVSVPIDFIIFDNTQIANYYGFTDLQQLLGGYYRYSLPEPSSSFTSTRYLDECGWARLVTNELMKNPGEMVTSPDGTLVYFVDSENSTLRKMDTSSPYAVTTIAGTPGKTGNLDGPGTTATFFKPQGLTMNPNGLPFLYMADTQNSTIRRIFTASPYTVDTIAGSPGVSGSTDDPFGYNARFNYLQALTILPNGQYIYVADSQNFTIRRVGTNGNYPVITIAGKAGQSGYIDHVNGTSALFNYPQALVCSPDGLFLYVADTQNFVIRKVSTTGTYTVTTISGTAGIIGTDDGDGASARFNLVQSLALSADGSILYIGDSNVVRKMITVPPYTVTTLAGTQTSTGSVDGNGTNATFNKMQGMAMSKSGTVVYLSDTGNSILRQVTTSSPYTVTTLAGSPFTTGSDDTGINTYPDDTMYYYINSISLSVGKQIIQQLPGGYLKMKKDISNTYKNRPILKLLEGDTNTSSSDRVYYLKTGLINDIPMHLLANQDVQVIVDTKIQQKSLIIDYVSFGSTNLPAQYTLIVPQVQTFHGSGLLDIKSPITKLMSDSPYEFSINGEKLFDSDTSNVSQIDNLLNVTTGYINVFRGPMNMSRIRNKAITIKNTPVFDSTSNTWSLPGSNIWSETFNVLKIENGLSGLLFESSFYSFGAPSSYLIS